MTQSQLCLLSSAPLASALTQSLFPLGSPLSHLLSLPITPTDLDAIATSGRGLLQSPRLIVTRSCRGREQSREDLQSVLVIRLCIRRAN